jgi:hypothetical protein
MLTLVVSPVRGKGVGGRSRQPSAKPLTCKSTLKPPMTWKVFGDLWPVLIANHIPVQHPDLIDTFITEGQAQRLVHFDAVLRLSPWGNWRLAANHLDPKTLYPAPVEALGRGRLIGDALRTAAYLPPPKKAGARHTYEVTPLWLPSRLERLNPRPNLRPPKRACTFVGGALDTLESFDPRAPIP